MLIKIGHRWINPDMVSEVQTEPKGSSIRIAERWVRVEVDPHEVAKLVNQAIVDQRCETLYVKVEP